MKPILLAAIDAATSAGQYPSLSFIRLGRTELQAWIGNDGCRRLRPDTGEL